MKLLNDKIEVMSDTIVKTLWSGNWLIAEYYILNEQRQLNYL